MGAKLMAATLCLVLLCSCGAISTGTEGLLQAPKLSQQQTEVYAALESTLPLGNIKQIYPQRGDFRSPFIFYDMDGDGQDEAVVFYAYVGDTNNVRAKILRKDAEGKWSPFHDIAPNESDQIDFVRFAHLLDKDASCMIIGWQNTRRKTSRLGVYSLMDAQFSMEALEEYQLYTVHDFDGKGLSEIVFVTRDAPEYYKLSLLRGAGKHLVAATSQQLCPEVERPLQLTQGKLWDGAGAVYIDEILSGGTIATEVLRVSGGKLELLAGGELLPDSMDNTPYDNFEYTFRDDEVLCDDVNGDGMVEIPQMISLPGMMTDEGLSPLLRLTQFLHLTETGPPDVAFYAAVNSAAGYLLYFPEEWRNTVTILEQPETGEWQFFKLDPLTYEPVLELLRIRVYTGKADEDLFSAGYQKLGAKGARSYYAYIPKTLDEPLAIDADALSKQFQLLK